MKRKDVEQMIRLLKDHSKLSPKHTSRNQSHIKALEDLLERL